jgi:hypothetical protein
VLFHAFTEFLTVAAGERRKTHAAYTLLLSGNLDEKKYSPNSLDRHPGSLLHEKQQNVVSIAYSTHCRFGKLFLPALGFFPLVNFHG